MYKLIEGNFASTFVLRSISICPVPATVLPSERVNDPSVSGLDKCFDPQCAKKTDSESCDGVVGCYWCVRDKYNAPLSKKYCADINSCYGGKEGSVCQLSSFFRLFFVWFLCLLLLLFTLKSLDGQP